MRRSRASLLKFFLFLCVLFVIYQYLSPSSSDDTKHNSNRHNDYDHMDQDKNQPDAGNQNNQMPIENFLMQMNAGPPPQNRDHDNIPARNDININHNNQIVEGHKHKEHESVDEESNKNVFFRFKFNLVYSQILRMFI